MTGSEELIERYLLHELLAMGLVKWDDGSYVFEGAHHDYLIDVKALSMGPKQVRLTEDG